MVNEYSMGIHDFIKQKIETASRLKQEAENSGDYRKKRFFDGQLHELLAIREYMVQHFDLKTQQYH